MDEIKLFNEIAQLMCDLKEKQSEICIKAVKVQSLDPESQNDIELKKLYAAEVYSMLGEAIEDRDKLYSKIGEIPARFKDFSEYFLQTLHGDYWYLDSLRDDIEDCILDEKEEGN